MESESIRAFWEHHDITKDKHAEGFLKSLMDRKKDLIVTTEKQSKFALAALLVFWVVALGQTSDDPVFLGVHFSDRSILLVFLMVLLSVINYKSILVVLHLMSLENLLAGYYSVWLPGACLLKLEGLLQFLSSEFSLSKAGVVKSSSAALGALVHSLFICAVLTPCNFMTLYWVAMRVTVPAHPFVKVIGIFMSLTLWLGALWIFTDFLLQLIKREYSKFSSTPGALLPRLKEARMSDLAKDIKLQPEGAYNGNARLFAADRTIVKCYEIINHFFGWEREHEQLLEIVPEVRQMANQMRLRLPDLFRLAAEKREQFAKEDSVENQRALDALLIVLQKESNRAKRLLEDYALPISKTAEATKAM